MRPTLAGGAAAAASTIPGGAGDPRGGGSAAGQKPEPAGASCPPACADPHAPPAAAHTPTRPMTDPEPDPYDRYHEDLATTDGMREPGRTPGADDDPPPQPGSPDAA